MCRQALKRRSRFGLTIMPFCCPGSSECVTSRGVLFGARPTPKQDWAYCVLLSFALAQSWERNSPISRRMIW